MPEFEEIIIKGVDNQEGIFVYLPNVSEFQKKEIVFHDAIHQAEAEVHQLQTVRNQYYHNYFKKRLYQLSPEQVILEIGAGAGYDLIPLLNKGYKVVASDISFASIKSVKQKIDSHYPQFKNQLVYLVADAEHLPLLDNAVATTFMVATFHHLENPKTALAEISRVTQNQGLIILAMEPSRFMMRFTKLFKNSSHLRIHSGHSEADETHPGYSKKDLRFLLSNFEITEIIRVWLLLGFLHYGLEAIFRLFKLKKRIVAPRWLEYFFLIIDEILLKIPIIKQLNWHWVVVIKNSKLE